MSKTVFQYYVEGECEANFLNTFMHAKNKAFLIRPGRIEKLNPVTEKISGVKAMTIKKGTKVVFVFDTDLENISILEENVKTLKRVAKLTNKDILFVMSVKCFEDELVVSCKNINNVKALIKHFGSQGLSAYKTDFSKCKNLEDKLKQAGFDMKLMWSRPADKPFDKYENSGDAIKSKSKE